MNRKVVIMVLLIFIEGRMFAANDYHKKYMAGSGDDKRDSVTMIYYNWFNMDRALDQVHGISTELAYKRVLDSKDSKTVVVAIIDSGIDIEHEDLKGKIWVNSDEIPGNGIDDDGNGHVDDIHGWNFLGNSDGENIVHETMEYTRIARKYEDMFSGKKRRQVPKELRDEYDIYRKAKEEYLEEKQDAEEYFERFVEFEKKYLSADSIIKEHLDTTAYSLEDIKGIETQSDTSELCKAREFLQSRLGLGMTHDSYMRMKRYIENKLKYQLNPDYNPRGIIEGDKGSVYGNNMVTGQFAEHGTHVAGIIAADRDNDIGIKGVADNVKIMPLRAVPNGDERDIDVANAIRYAVDNGAGIINMSFGKGYSPDKELVDDAVRYAREHNVLIIHASGNDANNIDKEDNFPTKKLNSKEVAENWISVGASSKDANDEFLAGFSNYGKRTVDVFAPGVKIYSLQPGDGYKISSGTSMAAPVVTGLAALLLSYYPDLSIFEIKDIILESSSKYRKLKINKPDPEKDKNKLTKLRGISVSGGVVNAYNAVMMAEEMSMEKE